MLILIVNSPVTNVEGVERWALSSIVTSVSMFPAQGMAAPSDEVALTVVNPTVDEIAAIAIDSRFTIVSWAGTSPGGIGPIDFEAIKADYLRRQQNAEIERTQAAILHLATSATPDAIASRVVYRRIFTMLNDIREHLNLPRILEPEIRDLLVADAQNGQGAPISLS